MNIKKHIPNLFTLGNLFCGILATLAAVSSHYEGAAILVVVGIIFDFFDGFLARILKVQAELGKQLDSLADMVTPGFVMFRFFEDAIKNGNVDFPDAMLPLTFLCFLLTLGAAYRLAKFNIDTRQSDSFIGLPTPAMSLFVVSLPIIYQTSEIEFVKELVFNNYFLLLVSVFLTVLMNSELKLLALKFKSFGWKGNEYRFVLIILSVVMLTTLQYLAIPLIIIAYVLLSIIQNVSTKKA